MPESQHQDEQAAARRIWETHEGEEGRTMDGTLTTDELCARAHSHRHASGYRIVISACALFAGVFAFNAVASEQHWIRFGQMWMFGTISFFAGSIFRRGPTVTLAGESCAGFLVRSLNGRREVLLEIQQGLVLLMPAMVACWWGAGPRAPVWPFIAVGLALAFVWFAFGRMAARTDQEVEEIRRSIQS